VKRLRCRLSPRERRPIGTLESYPQLLARQRLDQNQLSLPSQPPVFPDLPIGSLFIKSVRNVLKEKTGAGFGSHPFWDTHFVFTGGPLHARFRRAVPSSGRFLGADRKTT
jgi:hypothetical protein